MSAASSDPHEGLGEADVALTVPAARESVGVARRMVLAVAEHVGFVEPRSGDIAIAVSEACANAVIHAYSDLDEGAVDVLAWARPGLLIVSVRDAGVGISPRPPSERSGLGLGLPLMIAVADEVCFRQSPGGSNEVRLRFEIGDR